ncbi:MAG: hypothetical protein ABR613_04000, partial [Actinomycetota bacterium]
FYDLSQGRDLGTAKKMMIGGVWSRALLLAGLFVAFLRARPAPPEPGAEAAGVREPRSPEPLAGEAVAAKTVAPAL